MRPAKYHTIIASHHITFVYNALTPRAFCSFILCAIHFHWLTLLICKSVHFYCVHVNVPFSPCSLRASGSLMSFIDNLLPLVVHISVHFSLSARATVCNMNVFFIHSNIVRCAFIPSTPFPFDAALFCCFFFLRPFSSIAQCAE